MWQIAPYEPAFRRTISHSWVNVKNLNLFRGIKMTILYKITSRNAINFIHLSTCGTIVKEIKMV